MSGASNLVVVAVKDLETGKVAIVIDTGSQAGWAIVGTKRVKHDIVVTIEGTFGGFKSAAFISNNR